MDRQYWRLSRWRSWHAEAPVIDAAPEPHAQWITTACSLTVKRANPGLQIADRLPPTAHFCGNCARSVAAQTDAR